MEPRPPTRFARHLTGHAGIRELMDDLGHALATDRDMIMMGGGNPAHIEAVETVWRQRLAETAAAPGCLEAMLGEYAGPQGSQRFLETLADFFASTCGWPVTPANIALTAGSQMASFLLLNLFAGPTDTGPRHVALPLVPEYIGYADQGLADSFFKATPARIEPLEGRRFKYHIDFDRLDLTAATGAVCLSRPTNPSANVVSDAEMARLTRLTREAGVPLIVDNAYGVPFPGVIYTAATPVWEPHMVHLYSLSKLGLPGARTGIVVAHESIIEKLTTLNAVTGLSCGTLGPEMVGPLLENGVVARLCREAIRPFYEERSRAVQGLLDAALAGRVEYALHASEGAFFLWLWLPGLAISDRELYRRLKERHLLVVPGSYFFLGLAEPWPHSTQCIRLSYGQDLSRIEQGVALLAEEAARAQG